MLPQTNLQLYRVLLARDASEADLAAARRAYDLARELFSHSYRPNHKPFVSHLIGVAGALAQWGEPIETVVAGLLHSAYLYADFGDGARGVTESRRRLVRAVAGERAESLINDYTWARWEMTADEAVARVASGTIDRETVVLKLADLCDEYVDGGLHYAAGKPLEFGLPADPRPTAAAVGALVGGGARAMFEALAVEAAATHPPAALCSADRSFHTVALRGKGGASDRTRRFQRFVRGFRLRKA